MWTMLKSQMQVIIKTFGFQGEKYMEKSGYSVTQPSRSKYRKGLLKKIEKTNT